MGGLSIKQISFIWGEPQSYSPQTSYFTNSTFPYQKYALKQHNGIVMFFLINKSSFWVSICSQPWISSGSETLSSSEPLSWDWTYQTLRHTLHPHPHSCNSNQLYYISRGFRLHLIAEAQGRSQVRPCGTRVWKRQSFLRIIRFPCGQGISVGIATGYELSGPGIESRWGARFFAHVQTGPGAHPTSSTMGSGVSRG
jgi:hypothetical protein